MEASQARYRFGALSSIAAEAIGEPGKRTFKLTLHAGAATAIVWLEKEQLSQLGTRLQEIIATLSDEERSQSGDAPEPEWNDRITNLDFKAAKLALGYDSGSGNFLLLAHNMEEEDDRTATISCWISLNQGEDLGEEALRVCAAGRPQCPLCSRPIDPDGHMCPRANGHAPLQD